MKNERADNTAIVTLFTDSSLRSEWQSRDVSTTLDMGQMNKCLWEIGVFVCGTWYCYIRVVPGSIMTIFALFLPRVLNDMMLFVYHTQIIWE